MSQRGEWTFPVERDELRRLAEAKVEHHKQRLDYYESRVGQLEDEYRQSVKVEDREFIDTNRHSHSYGQTTMPQRQLVAQGDAEILRQLQEAQAKVRQHAEKIRTYDMWVELLTYGTQEKLDIDIEDAHFFGLGTDA